MPARSLVLVTVDCMRADHAGFLGYPRPTTPFLDCLSQESIVFSNAIVAGAPTYYSVPSILASRYPLAFGRDLLGIAPGEDTLASVFQDSGFATAAFSAGNPYVSKRFGFDRGFDVFCDFLGADEYAAPELPLPSPRTLTRVNAALSRMCRAVPGGGAIYDELYFRYCQRTPHALGTSLDILRRYPSADVIADRAISWLKDNAGKSFFLWLHLMDPHAPYFPKAEALQLMGDDLSVNEAAHINAYWNRGDLNASRLRRKREDAIKLYDAGIRWADEQIRRLTETLVELNLWDQCALAVTADHGEEFLEHSGRFHQPLTLTEELVHVPWLLRIPGERPQRVDSPVSLVDLAPTLLDVLALPSPADFHGRSRWKAAQKPAAFSDLVVTECVRGCTNPFRRDGRLGPRILAVRKNNFKLVMDFASGRDELFDLESDSAEINPLPPRTENLLRRELFERARKHVAESHKSRDFDRRNAMLLRDLRLEWAQPAQRSLEN